MSLNEAMSAALMEKRRSLT